MALVVDTNVLRDLHAGGVLQRLSRLRDGLITSDLVVEDELDRQRRRGEDVPSIAEILSAGLQEREIQDVSKLDPLIRKHRLIGRCDAALLYIGKETASLLITGDLDLIRAARCEDVPAHGTIWLLKRLVRLSILQKAEAATALEAMLAAGRRLPRSECEGHIRRWRRGATAGL